MTVDLSPPIAPSLISAELVEVVDDVRVRVSVQWIDNEARPDEFCTNFHFAGTTMLTATAYASDYGPGTGQKSAVVIAPKGQFSLSATTWRWVSYPDGGKISIGSESSNAIQVDTTSSAPASPGKGHKGNPHKKG